MNILYCIRLCTQGWAIFTAFIYPKGYVQIVNKCVQIVFADKFDHATSVPICGERRKSKGACLREAAVARLWSGSMGDRDQGQPPPPLKEDQVTAVNSRALPCYVVPTGLKVL